MTLTPEQKEQAAKALRSSLLSSWGSDASVIWWLEYLQRELAKVDMAIMSVQVEAALKDVFALIEEGYLVRNIEDDANPGFAMRQLPFLRRLAKAKQAIQPIEKEETKK